MDDLVPIYASWKEHVIFGGIHNLKFFQCPECKESINDINSKSIAKALKLNTNATERLLNALVALTLLHK